MPVKKHILTFLFILFAFVSKAQLEVVHVSSKGYSATGFGSFLNFAVPVSEGSYITAEAGFYYFKKDEMQMVLVPFLAGYRYMIDGTESGFYIEPAVGYSIGATDIQKKDANGNYLFNPDGSEVDQKAKGFSTAFSTGYIIPGNFPLNIGLRYNRVFVSGDPGLNLFSLRLTYALQFGRREQY